MCVYVCVRGGGAIDLLIHVNAETHAPLSPYIVNRRFILHVLSGMSIPAPRWFFARLHLQVCADPGADAYRHIYRSVNKYQSMERHSFKHKTAITLEWCTNASDSGF